MIGHPSFRRLARFAEGEPAAPARRRVASHLARCPRCRGTVAALRAASEGARALSAPPPPPGGLERVLAARAAGERVLLPVASVPAAPRRRRRGLGAAAVAAVVLLAGLGGLLSPPELQAGRSELRLSPERPRAGSEVEVEYRAAGPLARHTVLQLRAQLLTPAGQAYARDSRTVTLAELHGEDGVFRGRFRLPDSAVYTALAVQDTAGVEVDANGRRLWEVLVHDGAGRPTFEALRQRGHYLHGRNWEEAARSARLATELYPEQAESWHILRFFQETARGPQGADSVRAEHLVRFAGLDRRLAARAAVSGSDAGAMYFYARGVRDSVAAARWALRMEREHPRHPLTVQNRAVARVVALHRQPRRLLASLDSLWAEVGPAHDQLGLQGFMAARRLEEPEAIRRWADRFLVHRPQDDAFVAGVLARTPALREEGLARLRAVLAQVERGGDSRPMPLEWTAQERRRHREGERRVLLAAIGRALVEGGRTRPGLDTLALAMREGWELDLFRRVADTRLALGDTLGAGPVLAMIAADPATPPAAAHALRARVAGHRGARWDAWLAAAGGEMRSRTVALATTRPLRGPLPLLTPSGGEADLRTVTAGRAALVVFWSRHCGPALQALPELRRLAARLQREGRAVAVVMNESPSAELRAYLRENAPGLPVYLDGRMEANRAFESWGTPQLFVLDAEGTIRFPYTGMEAVPRQVAALQPPRSTLVAGGR